MNELLVKQLVDEGYLHSSNIKDAFIAIDRKRFVPESEQTRAYENCPLQIGHGQTISQPLTVAFMLELLEPHSGEKILDVGAGSGWQATLLAHLVQGVGGKVIAIERIEALKEMARINIEKYHYIEQGIVEIIKGNGAHGFKAEAPFDKIIAAASAKEIPKAWKEQVKVGGRIVAPVEQSIVVLDKISANEFSEKVFFGFSFVPLITSGR